MATHSSVLAWRIPGTGEPGGLPSMGSHRVGHDWSDLAAVCSMVNRVIAINWVPDLKTILYKKPSWSVRHCISAYVMMGWRNMGRKGKSKSGVDVCPSINSCCHFQGGQVLAKSPSHPNGRLVFSGITPYREVTLSLWCWQSGIQMCIT